MKTPFLFVFLLVFAASLSAGMPEDLRAIIDIYIKALENFNSRMAANLTSRTAHESLEGFLRDLSALEPLVRNFHTKYSGDYEPTEAELMKIVAMNEAVQARFETAIMAFGVNIQKCLSFLSNLPDLEPKMRRIAELMDLVSDL